MTEEKLHDLIVGKAKEIYQQKETEYGEAACRQLETICSLQTIDLLWKEHLLSLDHLKEGIGLRGYGQRNPLQEYQKEGFNLFEELIQRIKEETLARFYRIRIVPEPEFVPAASPASAPLTLSRGGEEASKQKTVKRQGKKVGRNDPCPCGSGKKYKKCCGQ